MESKNWITFFLQPNMRKLASITPGTVLIILAGGGSWRVVFLKQLSSGLLLVTGKFVLALNVVSSVSDRVNQSYVIGTKTKIDISWVNAKKFDDKYFAKEVQKKKKKGEGEFFEAEEDEKVLPQEKKDDQMAVDTPLDSMHQQNCRYEGVFSCKVFSQARHEAS
ncbi:hypothetical protein C1H46_022792 [Malus baccata]|uniref:Uncharacterized protein n=1 Tax=Malus baccata TaxID=106549 RepID=A0A540LZ72_MALBA|nr:hypothetical protein C1H46_022792 [Malus baccata]